MKEKIVILIGGAPTTGKSTIANLVAKYLNLPWISTDQIRNMMRITGNRNAFPQLFNPEGLSGEAFLKKFSAEEIVDMEFEQGEAAWMGIKDFIENDYTWTEGFVMEGVNLLPHLIANNFHDSQNIKKVFLVDEDADRIRDVIFRRGLWDDAHKYSDEVKEKEVEWVTLFSHKLKQEAEKNGYALVEVQKNEDDLKKVLQALKL